MEKVILWCALRKAYAAKCKQREEWTREDYRKKEQD